MKSLLNLSSFLWLLLSGIPVPLVLVSARGSRVNAAACTKSFTSSPSCLQSRVPSHKRATSHTIPAAVVVPPVLRNLARGSILKCLADLTGGLPLEVWKSSVVLENIRHNNNHRESTHTSPKSSIAILRSLLRDQGLSTLWSGLTPRMIEGLFSGGVLLASKELIHVVLSDYVSPMVLNRVGMSLPPSTIGFLSGAGGGMAQALVMGPTSLVVTACVVASQKEDGEALSALRVAQGVVRERGIRGLYAGAPAVAVRQATNWASRQGFTEWVRPRIPLAGVTGELVAGCIGGVLSAWNTPFEVARIESQSKVMGENTSLGDDGESRSLFATMNDIIQERGVGGLYVGLIPRAAQACYQTLFLVCVPRLLS
ncbi:hypothetical protein HJC23_012650 [Cyclotella cryptica]|uniref:Mitochondrial carrier protein n=1 Tax=Cyclotella cryptica TaxID=29204 RepID=A0ABD3QLI9_9STRA|eukprot:CCRYP_004210-RA/>CCRYP_004210-RA protein AED:0.37 eAED:0.37 QI:168/1/1/1/1/1/2/83/368